MNADKRRQARISVSVDVDFESGSNFWRSKARDPFEGGLFVETDVDLPIGTQVNVYVHVLGKLLCSRCKVVWQEKAPDGRLQGVGLQFVGLHYAAQKAILAFMALRTPIVRDAASAASTPESKPRPSLGPMAAAKGDGSRDDLRAAKSLPEGARLI